MTENTFFSNEAISLEKCIDLTSNPVETKLEDLDEVYEINRCAQWIQTNNFQRVCLQFPDHLLPDSSHVVLKLQKIVKQTLYLLGDTAYESCCIDYIAAAHINADAIIHFGPVCFSKTSANIPHINIYEKKPLNISKLKNDYDEVFEKSMEVVFLVDSIYLHVFDKIVTAFAKVPELQKYENVTIQRIDEIDDNIKNKHIFFLGEKYQTLVNIALTFKPKQLNFYDGTVNIFEDASKIIKRRHFIIEKIKDSETIGIIIGTLCVKNYLQILDRIKSLISQSGKKYYLISVGKPTVAKLANFPEMDIYVVVTCAMSEIYESRDFYKPIATPFDVEAALNLDPDKITDFTLDYNSFLNDAKVVTCAEPTVSLLTNKLRISKLDEQVEFDKDTTSLAVKDAGTVALSNYGAGYLLQRSWQGLEQNLGQTEAHLAKEGRDGIPLHYKNEENHS